MKLLWLTIHPWGPIVLSSADFMDAYLGCRVDTQDIVLFYLSNQVSDVEVLETQSKTFFGMSWQDNTTRHGVMFTVRHVRTWNRTSSLDVSFQSSLGLVSLFCLSIHNYIHIKSHITVRWIGSSTGITGRSTGVKRYISNFTSNNPQSWKHQSWCDSHYNFYSDDKLLQWLLVTIKDKDIREW